MSYLISVLCSLLIVHILLQGVTALSVWILTCIMFVFSAVMAYTCILSKNIINYIKMKYTVFLMSRFFTIFDKLQD